MEKYKATASKLPSGTDSPAQKRAMNVCCLPWLATGSRRDGFRNSHIQAPSNKDNLHFLLGA